MSNDFADGIPASRSCLACGSTRSMFWGTSSDFEYVTTRDTFDYYRCDHCDVLFIDPVPKERLAEIYPANYYSFAPSGQSSLARTKARLDARRYRRLLRAIPGNSLSALDVGG